MGSFIDLFIKYLSSTSYLSSTVPGVRNSSEKKKETAVKKKKKETAVNKTDEHFSLMEFLFKWNDQ